MKTTNIYNIFFARTQHLITRKPVLNIVQGTKFCDGNRVAWLSTKHHEKTQNIKQQQNKRFEKLKDANVKMHLKIYNNNNII